MAEQVTDYLAEFEGPSKEDFNLCEFLLEII